MREGQRRQFGWRWLELGRIVWFDAKGKPVDPVETGAPHAFANITDGELKAKLTSVLAKL